MVLYYFFIRKSQQRTIIKGLSFFVVAGLTAMYVLYEKAGAGYWVLGLRTLLFHYLLWQVVTAMHVFIRKSHQHAGIK